MTQPLSVPPSCTLWVNGVRYADGQPTEAPDAPVALTGLTVTWGRADTIDQPSPASCSFTVLDAPGGARFTDSGLAIGARVMVRADAVIYPDPSTSIITDPGFEAAAAGSVPSVLGTNLAAGRPVVSTARAHTGTKSARIDPADGARGVRVIFPPAPLSADPSAWDGVPKTLAGQQWSVGLAVWLPTWLGVPAAAMVRPAYFDAPWGPTRPVDGASVPSVAPDANGWTVFTGKVTPPADVWVGICLDVYPSGPVWDDLAPTLRWDALAATPTWDALNAVWVDDRAVLAPAAGAGRAGCVFNGRVTDLEARYDTDLAATIVEAIAQDDSAEFANRLVGAGVWPLETLQARASRVVTEAGQPGLGLTVDASAQTYQVTYHPAGEADSALRHVQDLAESVAGVAWCATSLTTGQFLRVEDVNARPALFILTKQGGIVVIIPAPVTPRGGVTIDACSVLLDPVRWVQTTSDIATRVKVTYQDQTDPVNPKQATVTSVDPPSETTYGRLALSLDTQLTTAVDAQYVADAVLGRKVASVAGGWRVGGLTWRAELDEPLTPAQLSTIMQILDGATRLGLPIMLTNLPTWSPVPATATRAGLYLEGGRMLNDAGRWQLELVTSSAEAQGQSLLWNQLDAAWLWNQFDPAIAWSDLAGVGV